MRNFLPVDENKRIIGFYKGEFGYPIRDLRYEPDNEMPFTPLKGEYHYEGNWYEGAWTSFGSVLSFQFDVRWSLTEVTEGEYNSLLLEQVVPGEQLGLWV